LRRRPQFASEDATSIGGGAVSCKHNSTNPPLRCR